MAEQKAELAKFKTCLGVKNTTCKLIKNVIDEEWLEALKDKILGFSNVSPLQMLTHLQSAIWTLDYMDEPQLLAKLMKPWDVTENPATKFACDDRIEK